MENENCKETQKFCSYQDALKQSTKYFNGDDLAAKVFLDKYALRDNDKNLLEATPDQMHKRIAKEFHRIEKKKFKDPMSYEEIYSYLDHFKKIIPQGSLMYGIGNPYQYVSLSNCFCLAPPIDSYSGILYTDEQLVQISKRRGGCVRSDSKVVIKDRGITEIKDVKIGDYVLSYNVNNKKSEFRKVNDHYYTHVKQEDQVKIKTSHGAIIWTTKKHPILTIKNNEYSYVKAGEIKKGDILITPEENNINCKYDRKYTKEEKEIGWFIGTHTGDGTAGLIYRNWNKSLPKTTRIRILGDNKNIIKEYNRICNKLCGSKAKYRVCTRKIYKTRCWEYICNTLSTKNIIDKYFDGAIGKKTYTCKVFSYVKKNDLWIPYIAGLIDSDGYVKKDGSIDLAMATKYVIYDVFSWLQSQGIRSHVSVKHTKRKNESKLYRLHITDRDFILFLSNFMKHNKKINRIICSYDNYRDFSSKYIITDNELENILSKYNERKYDRSITKNSSHNNMIAIIALVKKHKALGLGGLNSFVDHNLITGEEKKKIMQRKVVVDIDKNINKQYEYIDISVDGNNNYYAGNCGLINIHNCGLDISNLRPSGTATSNAARTSTGIISFMERYSNSIREVGQNGRRGALAITISVHHPEVLNFVNVKRNLEKITGANLSIRLSDEFMEAVEKDKDYEQRWPVDSDKPSIIRKLNARSVWKQIIENAWSVAEPGLLMWDNIIRESIPDCYAEFGFKTCGINPCSELILSALDSCRLLLLNLFSYVKDPFTKESQFDFDELYKDAQIAQRFMDNAIDLEIECIDNIIKKIKSDPEPIEIKQRELNLWKEIKKVCAKGRRTGTGSTGIGDTFAALGIKYASKESIKLAEKIYKTLKLGCYRSSVDMAKELGPFEVWDAKLEKNNPFVLRIREEDAKLYNDMQKYGRRNIGLLTIAPAGSVSILTQTTSGIEPLFKMDYTRRKKINPNDKRARVDFVDKSGDSWEEFKVIHPKVKTWMNITGETDLTKSPWHGCCAEELNWQNRIELQSIATKNICHSISSTINLPEDVAVEEVAKIYESAWKHGLKGITIYRKNSRAGVMIDSSDDHCSGRESNKINTIDAPKRPRSLPCEVHHLTVKGDAYVVFVGLLSDYPYEVFALKNGQIPKSASNGVLKKIKRGHYKAFIEDGKYEIENVMAEGGEMEEAITRLTSASLRHGADISFIVHQLEKAKGDFLSFEKAIARALKKYIPDDTKVVGDVCEDCGSSDLRRQEGCIMCASCGYSKCS